MSDKGLPEGQPFFVFFSMNRKYLFFLLFFGTSVYGQPGVPYSLAINGQAVAVDYQQEHIIIPARALSLIYGLG